MPDIKTMRESQRAGSVGTGTSTETFAQKNACHNHGTGQDEGTDPQFAEAEVGKNGTDASGY